MHIFKMSYLPDAGSLDALRAGRSGFIGQLPVGTSSLPANSVGTAQLQDGSVTSAKILDGTIVAADLANTGVSAGSYTFANITVNAQGQITAASSGNSAAGNFIECASPTNNQTTANPYVWGSNTGTMGIVSFSANTIVVNNTALTTTRLVQFSMCLHGTSGVTDQFNFLASGAGLNGSLPFDVANIAEHVYALNTVIAIPAGTSATFKISYTSGGAGFTVGAGTNYFNAMVLN